MPARNLLDATKMQEAIQSGKMESVSALLRGMTDSQQRAQLCATYGGSKISPGAPDKSNLYVRTSPMLHAARCSNSGAFSVLLRAAREMLKPQVGWTLVYQALLSGEHPTAALKVYRSAEARLPTMQLLRAMIKATDGIGRTILAMAASSGEKDINDTVLTAVKDELDPAEVREMMRAKDSRQRSLLAFAAESADEDTFKAVQDYLERELTEEEMYDLIAPEEYLGNRLLLQAVKSDMGKDLGLLKAVLKAVGRRFDRNNPLGDWIQYSGLFPGQDLLCEAIRCCEIYLFQRTPDFAKKHLADRKAAEEISTIFSKWANDGRFAAQAELTMYEHTREYTENRIEEFFQNLLRGNKLLDWVKTCFSGPLVSSKNPFVPGLALLLAFSRAAEHAPEGERRNLLSLQKIVGEFLLRVLERLPQTVRGCEGRINCSALFEPKHLNQSPSPLQMMVGKQKQRLIFCQVPLVMDYLSIRFSRGLPGLLDTDGILRDKEVLGNLAKTNGGLVLDYPAAMEMTATSLLGCNFSLGETEHLLHMRYLLVLLQGVLPNFSGLTGIPIVGRCPGLQFIAAGIVARPSKYYRVPMLRMALDFVVYMAMLAVFSVFVLVHSDGDLTPGEVIFFVSFVAAGALREVREMVRDFETYFEDYWNIMDMLALAALLGGFIVRSTDSASPWGQALYALSAPLVFSRVLFFAQILPFQGPMIQVIFSMTAELIQFGVVILVVLLGFVMAFFALFLHDGAFGQTSLSLFKAMLGDVGLFDKFKVHIQDGVATALLIVYVIIMNIMLLNLLIAVLSKSHSKMEENAEKEANLSKARVFQHYEMTVEKELLPAPFSLVQLAMALLLVAFNSCGQHLFTWRDPEHARRIETASRQVFGQAVFWLVLGPVAVVAGALLWILSVFYAPYAWTKYYLAQRSFASEQPLNRQIARLALQWLVIILWCGLVAPLCLVVVWLGAPLWSGWKWLNCGCYLWQDNLMSTDEFPDTASAPDSFDVYEMLLNVPGGVNVRDLFAYLADPMNDPEVRHGEIKRRTTVEHINLLRNHLDSTAKKQVDELRAVIGSTIDELREETRQVEQKLDKIMLNLGKVDLIPRQEGRITEARKARSS